MPADSYDIPTSGAHVTVTVADNTTVTTAVPPAGSHAVLVSCATNDIYATFDGTTPSATNGARFVKDLAPYLLHLAETTKWISSAAGGSTTRLTWLL